MAAPDAALLVDEAYFEFHGETVIGDISTLENLFVPERFRKPTDWLDCASACWPARAADDAGAPSIVSVQRECSRACGAAGSRWRTASTSLVMLRR